VKRKEKILDKQDKRVRNKVFKDKEKYHPKKAVAPFVPLVKKSVLPRVWPAVHLINAKLKEFAAKHDAITFFDATQTFSTKEPKGGHRLKNELISPRGHPSEFGFAMWEGQILGRLQKLIEERPAPRPAPAEEDYRGDGEEDDGDAPEESEDAPEEDEEESGGEDEGTEHVSAGKESVPPPVAEQPSRSAPSSSEVEKAGTVKAGVVNGSAKARKADVPTYSPTQSAPTYSPSGPGPTYSPTATNASTAAKTAKKKSVEKAEVVKGSAKPSKNSS
jgi:hypothetical protein